MKKRAILAGVLSAAMVLSTGTVVCQAEEKGGKEITYFYSSSGDDVSTELVKKAVERYEEKTGNTVKLTTMDGESYKTKIKTCVASNTLPDVFSYWTGEMFDVLTESGNILDLTEMINADTEYKDQFIGGSFEEVTVDGKIYAVPTSITGQVLYYNKALFEEAGISEAPKTLSELEADCEALKNAGITPIVVGSKDRWPLLGWFAYLAVRNGGMELYSEVTDSTSDVSFANDAFIEAGKKMNELSQKYFINGSLAIDSSMAPAQFAAGNAAMFVGGTWDIPTLTSNEETAKNFGFVPFPVVEGGAEETPDTVYGGIANCIAISASSEHPEDAYELVKELMSVDIETEKVERTGSLSCMKVEPNEDNMQPLAAEIVNFFNNDVKGFFPYTNSAIDPEAAERLLDAMTEIIASEDVDVEAQLAAIKR